MSVNDFQSNTPPVFEICYRLLDLLLANVDASRTIYSPIGSRGVGYIIMFNNDMFQMAIQKDMMGIWNDTLYIKLPQY